jgi:hypothetical protein
MKPQNAQARQSPTTPRVPLDAQVVDGETRRLAAALATRYFGGTVTLEVLLSSMEGSDDPLIHELLVAIAHEPARGFLGVSERRWQRSFREPVSRVIAELEKGAAGRVPEVGGVIRGTVWSLVGFGIGTVWASAMTIERAGDLITREAAFWRQAVSACTIVFGAVAATGFALAFHERLALYRMRRRSRLRP